MSTRYTVLPCGLKIRLHREALNMVGDYGAPEDSYDRLDAFQAKKATLNIIGTSRNLEAISEFFAKEAVKAAKVEEEEGRSWE